MKKDYVTNYRAYRLALILLVLAIALGSCSNSTCIKGEGAIENRSLQLDLFSKIEVNGSFKVYLTQGPVQQVEVKGEPNILSQLNTTVSNNTWKIEHKECIRRNKDVEVYITMPALQEVYLNGSGRISTQNTFTVTALPVTLNGSGKIDMNVKASQVTTRVIGSGEITLQGDTEQHSINISSSGRVQAFSLLAKNATVNLSGSGVAEVNAGNTLTVQISGSGSVYYTGSPTVSSSISGSGKVIKK